MKARDNLIKLILGTGMLLVTASSVSAQNCECPEGTVAVQNSPATELKSIGESDYPYFLNIKNLSRYSNIMYDGLSLHSPSVRSYRLISRSRQIDLNASYRKDGTLIDGQLIIKDSPLPSNISKSVIKNGFKGWIMIENKIIVHDFDAQRTEYEVTLQRGEEKQTLFLNRNGELIEKLSRT